MKKLIILLSLFCFVICPAFADEVIDDCYDMAKNYFDSGDYTSALEYANQILQKNPEHYGAAYIKIKLTPPQHNLGETNLTKSILVKNINGKIGDADSDRFNISGEVYFKNKDYANAKKDFQTSVKYNWDNYFAYNNLGLTYWKLKNYKKAANAFKRALFIKKDFSTAADNLAQLYLEQGQADKAEKLLKKAITNNDKDFVLFYLSGIANKELGKYTDASQDFNKAILLEPNCIFPYIQLADSYYYSKDYNWSNSTIDKYSELNSNDSYVYFMKYRNALATKDFDFAKNYIISAIMKNNCYEYRKSLGDVDLLLNLPKEAITDYNSIPNKTSEIYNSLGQCYSALGDKKQATDSFLSAVAGLEVRPIYFYNLANSYKENNDVVNYKKYMSIIWNFKPSTIQDYIDLSGIYLDTISKNAAIDILNQGIKKYPNSKQLTEMKDKIYQITEETKNEQNK